MPPRHEDPQSRRQAILSELKRSKSSKAGVEAEAVGVANSAEIEMHAKYSYNEL